MVPQHLLLVVISLGVSIPPSLCQDFLPFLDLGSFSSRVPTADDDTSSAINIPGGLPFGSSRQNTVYVGTNGLLSFGSGITSYQSVLFSTSTTSFNYVVAPFWADIDITTSGYIAYATFTSGSPVLSQLSSFIQDQEDPSFSGTWMIVAEWNGVPQFGGLSSITNTFQAAVITDGSTSYTVFTYRCGYLEWSGSAAIGYRASSSYYRNHPLSKASNVGSIACVNSPTTEWNNVVYKLTSIDSCLSTQFGCNNGRCISSSSRCTVYNGCGDGSDEEFCSSCYGGFLCNNGRCIASSAVGNGVNDCTDSSDESVTNVQYVTTAGGTTLSHGDAPVSSAISIPGGLLFGGLRQYSVYVSTNGLLSFGSSYSSATAVLFSSSSGQNYVVAPFWADIDTTYGGDVSYQTYTTGSSELSGVSSFVSNKLGVSFSGSWMIVAEWDDVPLDGQSSYITNTFQAIIISDGSSTYSVFIYRCGDLEWGANAAIGFKASSYYRNHPLSTTDSVQSIACANSPTSVWSNVVYKISSGVLCFSDDFGCNNGRCVDSYDRCDGRNDCGDNSDEEFCTLTASCSSDQFQCDNGRCIPDSYKCDGTDDCYDNSDEEGCVDLGLAIGLSIMGVILSFYGILCCVCMCVAINSRRRRRVPTVRTVTSSRTANAIPMGRVSSSSPCTTSVTSSRPSAAATRTAQTAQLNYCHPQSHHPQTQPEATSVPSVPPIHGEFIQEAPPSYDTAVHYPSPQFAYPPLMDYSQAVASAPPHDSEITSPSEAPPPYPGIIPPCQDNNN